MIPKDRIFKKGDVIVSGFGNVRMLVGETGVGVAGDGVKGVFYDAALPYCESSAPAGTDMRYARHATEREKKRFFQVVEANHLVYDAKTCTIKAGEGYDPSDVENYQVGESTKGPQPFKVVKKRVYPTLAQVRLLEEKIVLLDEIINTHCKEASELKDHLAEVKGCNEKMAKDLAILRENNDKLKEKNATLEQTNRLMKEDLDAAIRNNKELREGNERLNKSNVAVGKRCVELQNELSDLKNRGFWDRVFNL